MWRAVVHSQPVAELCQGALIDYILSLDWKIVPRNSQDQDELKSEIAYYTKLLNNGYDGLDYSGFIEWLGQDLLDLPFGFAAEIGRENDQPGGKVMWIHPLDGATLFPLPDYAYPVGQRVPGVNDPVVFPAYAISRIYMRPRTQIEREGWGFPPPERIYLSLQLLSRGDSYYANLLLDTPTAGILDLGDMEANTAKTWLASWQALMMGVDAFKVPVLYEHTTKAAFIPFGKPPTDIMFDRITLKYAAFVASGYGLTLSDINLSGGSGAGSGGETLSGSIRDERKSRKSGKAVMKRKVKTFWDNALPETLEFRFIDYDDEVNVAMGRARLSNAQAMGILSDKGFIDADEGRLQMIADGIFTINMPEKAPEKPAPQPSTIPPPNPNSRDQLGRPVPPSQGGHGEITDQTTKSAADHIRQPLRVAFDQLITNATNVRLRRLIRVAAKLQEGEVKTALKELYYSGSGADHENIEALNEWYEKVLFGIEEDIPEAISLALTDQDKLMDEALDKDKWWDTLDESKDLIAILQALIIAYQDSMSETAHQMSSYLYEIGATSTPDPEITFFSLQDEKVRRVLEKFATKIIERTNDGSRYYIRRLVMSEVRKMLTSKAIAGGLLDGSITLEHIFNDDRLMNLMVAAIQAGLMDILHQRLEVIPAGEETTVSRMAQVEMFKRAGLRKKAWRTLGPNPCEKYCIPNEKLGFVPLSHVYLASFPEGVLQPQAHANCECDLIFNKDEIADLAKSGKFRIWGGEGKGTPALTPMKVTLAMVTDQPIQIVEEPDERVNTVLQTMNDLKNEIRHNSELMLVKQSPADIVPNITVINQIPGQEPPVVNVTTSPTPVTVENTVNVPNQPVPDVNNIINMPEQPVPVVNVQSPDVNVAAPQVTVNVPEQPVPVVNVQTPPVTVDNTVELPDKKVKFKITRENGEISGIEEK